jgi:hypothetical protein
VMHGCRVQRPGAVHEVSFSAVLHLRCHHLIYIR